MPPTTSGSLRYLHIPDKPQWPLARRYAREAAAHIDSARNQIAACLRALGGKDAHGITVDRPIRLAKSEVSVAHGLSLDLPLSAIASLTGMSEPATTATVNTVCHKLGARGRSHAVATAMRVGVIR